MQRVILDGIRFRILEPPPWSSAANGGEVSREGSVNAACTAQIRVVAQQTQNTDSSVS